MKTAIIDTEQIKRNVNLIDLAGRYTTLRRESARERSGPCPKCGGRDRFHCTADWFFCRQCHPKRGDAIEFVQWIGIAQGFKAACEALGGSVQGLVTRRRTAPAKPRPPAQADTWRRAVSQIEAARLRLLDTDNPAAQYLLGRGLDPITWYQWGWGYEPAALIPGTRGRQRAAAVTLPWYAGGRLVAVRYRFITGKHRIASRPGSRFAGRLYGGHVLPDFVRLAPDPGSTPAEAARTLLLCEGEINAASIWQIHNGTRLDVLSLGSEAQRVPGWFVDLSKRYGQVIVWLDRPELARAVALQLPHAHAVHSPWGMDANDLLQRGLLADYLASVRARLCVTDWERRRLAWELLDGGYTAAEIERLGLNTGE